jgi:hypothetical protein
MDSSQYHGYFFDLFILLIYYLNVTSDVLYDFKNISVDSTIFLILVFSFVRKKCMLFSRFSPFLLQSFGGSFFPIPFQFQSFEVQSFQVQSFDDGSFDDGSFEARSVNPFDPPQYSVDSPYK